MPGGQDGIGLAPWKPWIRVKGAWGKQIQPADQPASRSEVTKELLIFHSSPFAFLLIDQHENGEAR